MMDFVTVEKGKIMAEYIACRRCDSPDCKGCNLKRLETMLGNGKFDCTMNENRAIDTSADVEPVRHGRWLCVDTDTEQFFLCNRCKKKEYWESKYCPSCGAKMDCECDA